MRVVGVKSHRPLVPVGRAIWHPWGRTTLLHRWIYLLLNTVDNGEKTKHGKQSYSVVELYVCRFCSHGNQSKKRKMRGRKKRADYCYVGVPENRPIAYRGSYRKRGGWFGQESPSSRYVLQRLSRLWEVNGFRDGVGRLGGTETVVIRDAKVKFCRSLT